MELVSKRLQVRFPATSLRWSDRWQVIYTHAALHLSDTWDKCAYFTFYSVLFHIITEWPFINVCHSPVLAYRCTYGIMCSTNAYLTTVVFFLNLLQNITSRNKWHTLFTSRMSFLSPNQTVSKHWRKSKALTPTSGMEFFIHHWTCNERPLFPVHRLFSAKLKTDLFHTSFPP